MMMVTVLGLMMLQVEYISVRVNYKEYSCITCRLVHVDVFSIYLQLQFQTSTLDESKTRTWVALTSCVGSAIKVALNRVVAAAAI